MAKDGFTTDLPEIMSNNTAERLNGVVYFKFFEDHIPSKAYDLMKKMKVRESDIIATGFPRSGNHWTYDIMHMILHQTTEFALVPYSVGLWDLKMEKAYEELEAMPSPRHVAGHTRPHRFPTEAVEKNCKVVFILRNPKDSLRSFYKIMSQLQDETVQFKGTWEEFFDVYMQGHYLRGTWFDLTLDMDKFIEDNPGAAVHVHLFENMIKDPLASVKKLCHFLGKPEKMSEDIVKATAFSNMKTKSTTMEKADEIWFGKDKDGSLMSKGLIGEWRKRFTVAQNERFNKVFEEKMAGSKLADMVREYMY